MGWNGGAGILFTLAALVAAAVAFPTLKNKETAWALVAIPGFLAVLAWIGFAQALRNARRGRFTEYRGTITDKSTEIEETEDTTITRYFFVLGKTRLPVPDKKDYDRFPIGHRVVIRRVVGQGEVLSVTEDGDPPVQT